MRREPAAVGQRARAITARGETQLWIVASTAECQALEAGRVPPAIRRQAARWVAERERDRSHVGGNSAVNGKDVSTRGGKHGAISTVPQKAVG